MFAYRFRRTGCRREASLRIRAGRSGRDRARRRFRMRGRRHILRSLHRRRRKSRSSSRVRCRSRASNSRSKEQRPTQSGFAGVRATFQSRQHRPPVLLGLLPSLRGRVVVLRKRDGRFSMGPGPVRREAILVHRGSALVQVGTAFLAYLADESARRESKSARRQDSIRFHETLRGVGSAFDSRRLHQFSQTISACCAWSVQRTRVRIEWALWRGSAAAPRALVRAWSTALQVLERMRMPFLIPISSCAPVSGPDSESVT